MRFGGLSGPIWSIPARLPTRRGMARDYARLMRWRHDKPLTRGEYALIGLLIALNVILLASQAVAWLRALG